MKVIEAPVYRSDDGLREFKSQDECIEYEKFILLRAIIHKHARGIVYQAEVANFILKAWSEISLAMQHNGEACAIESALQPGWRDIESAPRDGSKILLAKYGWSNDAGDAVQGSDEWKRRILDQTRRKYGLWWCVAGHWSARWNNWNDGVEPSGLAGPTHWMPLPPAPKATK